MYKLVGIWLMIFSVEAISADSQQISADSIALCFAQVEEATARHKALWDKDIYGPILVVDPASRELYANVADREGHLSLNNGIYRGLLPREVTIANTDFEWGGIHWAMVKMPLPQNRFDRVDLITHELFHSAQSSLGFHFRTEENSHLDHKDGRIYLRLELA